MKSLIQRRANPPPLGEIQHNQQSQSPRPAPMPRDVTAMTPDDPRGRSPTKSGFGTLSLKAMASGPKSREASPTKHKKTKSGTNLAGLLGRPKSLRNLHKLVAAEEDERRGRDKENRSPGENREDVPTPIFAQFTRDSATGRPTSMQTPPQPEKVSKPRPRSFHPHYLATSPSKEAMTPNSPTKPKKTSSWDRSPVKPSRPGINTSHPHSRSKSHDASMEPQISPQDINRHLEAMLNRRNIPENQRYKMRNLNDTIKMEFIRQDWAEMAASKNETPKLVESEGAAEVSTPVTGSEREEKKKNRGMSFTLGKANKGSSGKKGREGTLGRHFRTRSTESITSERPVSGHSSSSASGILSKIKLGQGPSDFVAYLRKVTKPELVEVGKLHKLRLLLRNETVSWTEEFIQLGGMKEIVDLLYRIMEVEWR